MSATSSSLSDIAPHPVDERLPSPKLFALGLQHVLVMYAGAVAVPLIVGRALQLSSAEITMLISADLFCCGLVTMIQTMGMTQWFGVRLPVIMGVSFAPVTTMLSIAQADPSHSGAQLLFGTVIGAGIITILIAPLVGRLLRYFPPVVTGSIITVLGITLMRVGINWVFGNPVGPTAPFLVSPEHSQWLASINAAGGAVPAVPEGLKIMPSIPNPKYATLTGIGITAIVLMTALVIVKYTKGFLANIAVLLGLVVGTIVAVLAGLMTFEKVARAPWFELILPFHFGMPKFDIVLILSMTLIMIVVMIETTGMLLALSDMTDRPLTQKDLSRGLRTDGLGTLIGGIFNTFPYTSFSQNVGLVAVTGVKSRYVCFTAGLILIVLGLVPKISAIVESLPTIVLGGAGLIIFGMVATTGIRILANVDFKNNRNNAMIVAITIAVGMIPSIAPNFKLWIPTSIHHLVESGIVLASVAAILLNLFLNGAKEDVQGNIAAAKASDSH